MKAERKQVVLAVMGFIILCIGIQFVVNGVLGIVQDPAVIHAIRDAVVQP